MTCSPETTPERGDTYGGIFWLPTPDGGWRSATLGEACAEIKRLRALIRDAFAAPLPPGKCQISGGVVLMPLAEALKLQVASHA